MERENEWNKFLAGFEEPSGVIPAGSLKALRQAFDAGWVGGYEEGYDDGYENGWCAGEANERGSE
jgi:hypothetical protein